MWVYIYICRSVGACMGERAAISSGSGVAIAAEESHCLLGQLDNCPPCANRAHPCATDSSSGHPDFALARPVPKPSLLLYD